MTEGRREEKPLHSGSSLWLVTPNRQRKGESCPRWYQPGLSLRLAGAREREGGVDQEGKVPDVPVPSWGLLRVRAGRCPRDQTPVPRAHGPIRFLPYSGLSLGALPCRHKLASTGPSGQLTLGGGEAGSGGQARQEPGRGRGRL